MKKKILLLMMAVLAFGLSNAQVGINTTRPLGWFHVDPGGTTGGTAAVPTNDADDVIVTTAGNVGIGTANPNRKLHILSTTAGAIQIQDGTQGVNKVLTSNAAGVGTWEVAKGSLVRGHVVSFPGGINATPAWVYTNCSIVIPANASCIISAAAQFQNIHTTDLQPGLFLAFSRSNTVFTNASPGGQTVFNRSYIVAGSYSMCAGFVTDINNTANTPLTLYMWANSDRPLGQIRYIPNNTVNDVRLYAVIN